MPGCVRTQVRKYTDDDAGSCHKGTLSRSMVAIIIPSSWSEISPTISSDFDKFMTHSSQVAAVVVVVHWQVFTTRIVNDSVDGNNNDFVLNSNILFPMQNKERKNIKLIYVLSYQKWILYLILRNVQYYIYIWRCARSKVTDNKFVFLDY